MSKVKVVMTGHGLGEVWLDGKKLKGVVSVSFSAGLDKTNEVSLKLLANDFELEVEEASVELEKTPNYDSGLGFKDHPLSSLLGNMDEEK